MRGLEPPRDVPFFHFSRMSFEYSSPPKSVLSEAAVKPGSEAAELARERRAFEEERVYGVLRV